MRVALAFRLKGNTAQGFCRIFGIGELSVLRRHVASRLFQRFGLTDIPVGLDALCALDFRKAHCLECFNHLAHAHL